MKDLAVSVNAIEGTRKRHIFCAAAGCCGAEEPSSGNPDLRSMGILL